jgi:hypothetical protein
MAVVLRASRKVADRFLVGVTVVALGVGAVLSATLALSGFSSTDAGANPLAWSIEPSQSYTAPVSFLESISCVSSTACISVGTQNVTGAQTPLAESWNGTSWTVESIPAPAAATSSELLSVSCPSSTTCIAVGNYQTSSGDELPLAETFDGSVWTIDSASDPAGADVASLNAISCQSGSSCTAVGSYSADAPNQALAETLSGTTWTIDSVPDNVGALGSELLGLSCLSSTSCTAVGDFIDSANFDGNLVEVLKGTTWSLQSSPSPSSVNESNLLAVSCASSKACVAVGEYDNGHEVAMAEDWNGKKWTLVDAAPGGGATSSDLAGVVCVSSKQCIAVGVSGSDSLAEQWNGTTWSTLTTTSPGSNSNNLTGISCPGASTAFCGAVGLSANGGDDDIALAESWNGAAWSTQGSPLIYGGGENELKAISCVSATSCMAVGALLDTDGVFVPMAEEWDGSSWSVDYAPVPAGAIGSGLSGVSCTGVSDCVAVGNLVNAGSHTHTLAEQWNGTDWTIVTTPNPPHTDNATLTAISCSQPTACTAVGSYNTTGPTLTLAETLSGTTWSIVTTPNRAGATGSELNGVSCPSADVCTAVGDYLKGGIEGTMTESTSGTTWSIQKSPNPASSQGSELDSVSCPNASSCVAVGFYGSTAGVETTLAEKWNGMTWKIKTTPALTGTLLNELASVSCTSAKNCIAVGSYDASSTEVLPLAEQWNGANWVEQSTPAPAGASESSFAGVSCTAAAECSASGQSAVSGNDDQTLFEAYGA